MTQVAQPDELTGAILRAILYADLFDFPMRAEEIHRQLLLVRADLGDVAQRLRSDVWLHDKIEETGGLYHLIGRSALCERRNRQREQTDALIQRHITVLRLLSAMPYVRMVAFSGGTSRKNSVNDNDLDLFIVAEKGRAWTVYTLMVVLARALGCRDVLCANYLVDRVHVTVPDGGDLFTGHELMALRPLIGERWLAHMVQKNAWVERLMPNASARGPERLWESLPAEPLLRRGLELGLWPQLWLLERGARTFLGRRLQGQADRAGTADVLLRPGILKLHTTDNRGDIVTKYRDRLHEWGLLEDRFERALGKRLRRRHKTRAAAQGLGGERS
ncbi:MAG: hypothetical protein KC502_08515 [Myxococcales bacterium]|nr:hypothetical protein [Myxococcales bacterium]